MNCASRKSGTNIEAAERGEQYGKTRLDFMPSVRQQNATANTVRYRTDTLSSVLSQVQERVIDQCKTANGIGYQRARRFDAEPITQDQILMLSAFSCLYRFIICPAAEKKKNRRGQIIHYALRQDTAVSGRYRCVLLLFPSA